MTLSIHLSIDNGTGHVTLTPDQAEELADHLRAVAYANRIDAFSRPPKLVLPVKEGFIRLAEEQSEQEPDCTGFCPQHHHEQRTPCPDCKKT